MAVNELHLLDLRGAVFFAGLAEKGAKIIDLLALRPKLVQSSVYLSLEVFRSLFLLGLEVD